MHSILSLFPAMLGELTAQKAVERFRDLLWAQAWRLRYPVNKVHISTQIEVPDGGVDVRVDADQTVHRDDPLLGIATGYQLKTGSTFVPWQPSSIKKELFGEKDPANAASLGSAVRRCMDNDDRYVLVCFGLDINDDQRNKAVETLVNAFRGCGYSQPKVEVWGQNHLIAMFSVYPSLCLLLARRDHFEFRSHASWSLDAEMQTPLHLDDNQSQLIQAIRSCLRGADIKHIRVVGEPGVGKTRLVREATSEPDLAPLVIFVTDGEIFQRSELFRLLLREDNRFHVVLVIDECAPRDSASIWNALKGRSERVRLITLDHGPDDATDSQMQLLTVPGLDRKQIAAIIREYGLSELHASRWAEFCEGSPRVAHVIGMNLQNNPDDLLRPPATMRVWERYICGRDAEDSPRAQQQQTVLRLLSLFERFGFESPVEAEAVFIAGLVHDADPNITSSVFQSLVMELKARRILQGRTTLYITPRLFHAYLFRDFWEHHGRGIDLGQLLMQMPPGLLGWFTGMLKFAHTSDVAATAVQRLLGPDGLFQDETLLESDAGSRLMLALAETDPGAALACLQRAFGHWDRERLLRFVQGRRHVVRALERIAAWDEHFVGATQLLLALAEAENERFANNASGVFAALFSLLPGMAVTQSPPSLRLSILRQALASPSPERRKIGLRACAEALSVYGGLRIIGAEFQGLRPAVKPYCPKTYGDLWRSYRDLWNLLIDTTRQWNEEERRAANSVAIKAAHGILPMRPASQAVMDSLEAFVDDPATDQRELIHAVTRMLQRREGRLEPEIQERLRQLNKRLQGSDFASRLRRFITYRVNEDDIDQKGELTARWTTEIENLAKRAVSDPALLPPELPWLVGDQTGNSLAFGLELGKLDPEERWLTPILNAQRTAADQGTVPLLAGYLGSCFHRNVARWEEIVSSLSVDPILRRFMNDVLFYSGTTERTLARAVELAEIGVLPAESFRVWGFGKRLRRFSENLLRRLLNLLLKANTFASIETSLQLCHGFYLDEEAPIQLPEDLTLKLLTHPILFSEQVAHHSYGVHCWSEIAQRFVDLYPLHSMTLLDNLLGCADDFHSLISIRKDPGPAVSARIIQQDPQGAWYRITNLLGNDLRTNQAWKIEQWLGGNYNFGEEEPGPITLFPPQLLWDWVSGNKADRALWLAKTIPLSLDPHQGGSLAREFLVRYGHEEDAANLLMARFVFRGYCGAESDHYRRLRDQGRKWLSTETDALVREWIERYIATFHERIRQAEIREERDD